MSFDLVVRNGTIVDGTGKEGFVGDVAVSEGTIREVGKVEGKGREEIDATGLLVTPGFVDIHTHYDGQATWDNRLWPSSLHGVTTVVMGNCGVGFAPCRAEDRDLLVRLMEGVEDIPAPVLAEGLKWDWESFPDYMDALERLPHDIDFAAQLPHAALRVYVMGERGANREPATEADIAQMSVLARRAVEAGALGFSTSRSMNHRASDGRPTPTLRAEADELIGIARGLKEANRGVLEFVSDFKDMDEEIALLHQVVESSGRPLSISIAQSDAAPDGWRRILAGVEAAVGRGLPIRGQVCGRPVGVLLGLQLTLNPFSARPSYRQIADLPFEERVRIMRDPAFRARLLAEEPVMSQDNTFLRSLARNFDRMFELGDPPEYEPPPEKTIGARAAAMGVTPDELAYDILMSHDGKGYLLFPFLNYASGSLDPSLEMMRHKDTVLGLGDGGAHVGLICDGSLPTYMLTHWTRDRSRGEKLPLPWVVKAQTADTARAVGLTDRGVVAPGYKADLNVIDYDRLRLRPPRVAFDLPAGGRRLLQEATGYVATIASGQVIYRDGVATGALPGRLLRGA